MIAHGDSTDTPRWMQRGVRVLEAVCMALLVIIFAAVLAQIIMRYWFNNAPSWSDPLASHALAWMVLLGTSAAVLGDANLAVRFVWTRLSGISKRIVQSFCQIAVFGFSACLVYSGVYLMSFTTRATIEGLEWPVSQAALYSATVIAGLLMCLFSAARLFVLWRR